MATRVRYTKSGSATHVTTSSGNKVEIEGLKAFHKALKVAGEGYPAELRQANFDLASEVVNRSRMRAMTEGGSARKASRSLRAFRSSNQAMVVGGGARYPYFFGAEFGSKQYGQFKPWRGNQWGGWDGGPGYFLHPTIREEGRALIDAYMERLDALTAQAFPNH